MFPIRNKNVIVSSMGVSLYGVHNMPQINLFSHISSRITLSWTIPYKTFSWRYWCRETCWRPAVSHTTCTPTTVEQIFCAFQGRIALIQTELCDGTCGWVRVSPPSEGTDKGVWWRGGEGGASQVGCSCRVCSTCSFRSSICSPHWKMSPSSSLIQTHADKQPKQLKKYRI